MAPIPRQICGWLSASHASTVNSWSWIFSAASSSWCCWGGHGEAGRRRLRGEVASRLADRVYVTDDNPRTEPPAEIRRAILAAAPNAVEIGDRREAIATAIAELEPGDLLVIAGKGHETGQIVGTKTYPFDDAAIAREFAGGSRPSSL